MSSHQIIGTVTILSFSICCIIAYRWGKQGEYTKALICIILSGLILQISSGMYFFIDAWDERYHALVAKNLLSHPLTPTLYDDPAIDYDFRSWTNNHIWIHKPPMALWLIAASLKLFGLHEIAVRLPSIVLLSLGGVLTFFIARHFFDAKTGLLASFLHVINGLLIELATGRVPTDHVDIAFIFFIEFGIFLAIYSIQRPSFLVRSLIGVITGCAILTKSLPGLIIIAVYFVLLLQEENWKKSLARCALTFVIACVVFIPWQIYIFSAFPQEAAWENYFNTYLHVFEPLDGHGGTVFYHFLMIPRIFGELIYIPLFIFFCQLYRKKLPPKALVLVVWFILPFLFFSFVVTKMPGYIMISAPAIFIILAAMIWEISERNIMRNKTIRVVLLILLVFLPLRYSLERVRPFREIDRNPPWVQELRLLNSKVGGSKAAVFNVEHYVEAMFYANVSAYPLIPNRAQVNQARGKGFRVFIYDSPDIPADIRNIADIVILQTTSQEKGQRIVIE